MSKFVLVVVPTKIFLLPNDLAAGDKRFEWQIADNRLRQKPKVEQKHYSTQQLCQLPPLAMNGSNDKNQHADQDQ